MTSKKATRSFTAIWFLIKMKVSPLILSVYSEKVPQLTESEFLKREMLQVLEG